MMRRRHTPAMLALALITSGCATTRLTAIPAQPQTPAQWATTAEGVNAGARQDLSRWWEQLGDATLTSLIERALTGSPDIRTAQARLRQARAERAIAAAPLVPSVSVSASASDRDSGSSSGSVGFDASWEPDFSGATRNAVSAASAEAQASAEDAYGTQVSLAAEVARTYVELRTLQGRLDIARQNESSQDQTLQLAGFRVQAGLATSVDSEQARANLEQTRAGIPSLESSIAQAIHRLAVLAGLEPTALVDELTASGPLPAIPSEIAVGIPADSLRQRPDVRAAELRVAASSARVSQAQAARYPTVSLSGSIGAEVLGGIVSGGTSLATSVAASVLKTVFDRGRTTQQIVVQDALMAQSVSEYQSTVLTALEDVENALVSFEKNRQRLDSLTQAATAASNAALLARNQYQAGLTDFQRVLDTERTALSVQDNIATTQGDRLTALVQLYKALGGGWRTTTS